MKHVINLALIAFLTLGLGACSSSSQMNNDLSAYDEVNDPLEPVNRAVFEFNGVVDTILIRPIAKGYRMIVPELAREGVSNFLANLKSPVNAFNQLLQGDFTAAGETALSFVVNTTLGIGGLGDVAADQLGLENEEEDFGQTLAVWGVPEGPYIVWPILGPSNARDSVGFVADVASDPMTWYVNRTDNDWINYTEAGLTLLDTKARLMDPLDEIRANSLDYYAAIRSVYTQFRRSQVRDTANSDIMAGGSNVDIPDYDEYEMAENE